MNAISVQEHQTTIPPALTEFKVDFGTSTSPIETGYTRVTDLAYYSVADQYGWLNHKPTSSVERSSPADSLHRDFVNIADSTFVVDVANGTYDVAVTLGDSDVARNGQEIRLEGTLVDTISTGVGQHFYETYVVTVSDGQLTMNFSEGSTRLALNAISVQEHQTTIPPALTEFKVDFGRYSNHVAAGYNGLDQFDFYSEQEGFGWLNYSAAGAGHRDAPGQNDTILRDFVSVADSTFVVDVVNGTYDVTVTLGDYASARTDQEIRLEGTLVDTVSTSAWQFHTDTYAVTVNDGQLTIDLDEGSTTVAINAIELSATNLAPTTSGIADLILQQGTPTKIVDLWSAFADAEDLDSALTFQVDSNNNSTLVTTGIDNLTGELTLTFDVAETGTAEIVVRATDTGGLFTTETFTVQVAPVAASFNNAVFSGSSVQLQLEDGGLSVDDYIVDWGDGSSAETVSGAATTAAHIFTEVGDFDVEVTADVGGTTVVMGVITVRVNHPVQTNLVVNGSFEDEVVTANGGNWELFTTITGWTVGNGSTENLELHRNFQGGAEDGVQHAELDAHSNPDSSKGSVAISQTIDTLPGQVYTLTFAFRARPSTGISDNRVEVTVSDVGTSSTLFQKTEETAESSLWTDYEYEFIATGTQTTLKFADVGVNNTLGTLLDNVRLYGPDVPTSLNAPPSATDDAYEVATDGTLAPAASQGVLVNDSDPDSDSLLATLGTDVQNGTLYFYSDGSFTYTPDAAYVGTDSFTYFATDGYNSPSEATVTIEVKSQGVEITATDSVAHETLSGEAVDLGEYTITRSNSSGSLTVALNVTSASTASSGDYTESFPMNVVFADGETSKTVTITPVNDSGEFEDPETVIVEIVASSAYAIGSSSEGTVTIYDNELRPFIFEGCADCEDILGQSDSSNSGAGATTPAVSAVGVRSDGMVTVSTGDLYSGGFGTSWAQTNIWTNQSALGSGNVGNGMITSQMPKLIQEDSDTYVATSGSRARWYDLASGTTFEARGTRQDTIEHDTVNHELLELDTTGNLTVYYDFDASIDAELRGTFKRFEDAAGIVSEVISTTVDGQIEEVQRSDTTDGVTTTESYLYTYNTSGPADGNVSTVTLRRKIDAGAWETVRTTEYDYYDGVEANGNAGDLKKLTVKDDVGGLIDSTYYRYYVPGEANGYPGGLKYVFHPHSYERLAEAIVDPEAATDAQVAEYADGFYEYDAQRRVTKVISQGDGCSACSGGLGTFEYSYAESSHADDYNNWKFKTTETLPDGNQNIVYTNYSGQTILEVFKDSGTGSGDEWITYTQFDSEGRVVLRANPSAVIGYDEAIATLVDNESVDTDSNLFYLADNTGLIYTTSFYATTTATEVAAGAVAGFYESMSLQQGELGTSVLQNTTEYYQRTAGGDTVNPIATNTVYRNDDGTGGQTTSYDYTWFTGTVQQESVTVSLPVVSAAQNGSGTADESTVYFDTYGRAIWSQDAEGFLTYMEYDQGTGSVIKMIADVDTTQSGDFSDLPTGWSTPAGGGLHLVSTMEVDGLGRTTKTVDPNGVISYTVYNDDDFEVRTYRGWDEVNDTALLPTIVQREDRAGSFTESIVMSGTPAVDGSGRPTGTEAISNIENLTRTYISSGGQVTHVDSYFDFTGMSDPATDVGTEGTNFLRTTYSYDHRGRQDRTEDSTGTINRTVYDGLNRVVSSWTGTNDTPASGEWSPTNNDGTANMVQTMSYEYDNDGVGDSNVTLDSVFADDTTLYETEYDYDFRNRATGSKGPDAVAVDRVFDNLGQVTQSNTYADLDDDFVLDSGELRARSEAKFDEQRRVYEQIGYEVNQATGAVGNKLTSEVFYNKRGFTIKSESPNGLFGKTEYDGAGRAVASYTSFDTSESTWAEADDVTGDTVIEQSETIYDPGSRAVAYLSFQRLEDDVTTTGALDGSNSYRDASVMWYDIANRVTNSATFGRDDDATNHYVWNSSDAIIDVGANGIPDVAEGAAYLPNQSADWIASKTEYDDAGRAHKTTDNLGRVRQTEFDKLNRTTKVIDNYVNGVVTETETDTDVTVEYVYDSAGRMQKLIAKNPKGTGNGVEDQETLYLFESDFNGSWVTNTIYPDSADTDSTGTDQVKTTYDRLGRTITTTDQRGVEHTFSYDSAGRFESDAVTSLGTSGIVDDAILRIERAYDDMSRVESITSYDAGSGGNVVNQVEYAYNGYQLVSEVHQEHDGAVDGSTQSVAYNYDDGAVSGDAKYVRLTSVDYPGGRTVHYIYPGSGIGDVLNRVEAIADEAAGTTRFAEYEYLGAGTIVSVAHPEVSGGLTLDYNTTGDYEGWDTFGRVVDQRWTDGAGTTDLDRYQYTYDYNSNRTGRDNELYSTLDEAYTYDGLDRMIDTDRNGADYQEWELDSLGNWNEFDDDGTVTDRTHNAANELTAVSGSTIDPTFDAAGNMVTGPRPGDPTSEQEYIYDAWNRMVEVRDDLSATIAEFEYDGRNYRIQKTASGIVTAYYHNEGNQVLEERVDGDVDPSKQFVWDLRYIDAPIVRFQDTNTDGTVDNSLYYTNDANMNVTGLVDETTGSVVERYHYDPYGKPIFMSAGWTALGTQVSAYDNVYLFTGRELDYETMLQYSRARYYDVTLARWSARDPIGYEDGQNLYQYVQGSPKMFVDPQGLSRLGKQLRDRYFSRAALGTIVVPQIVTGGFEWLTGFHHSFQDDGSIENASNGKKTRHLFLVENALRSKIPTDGSWNKVTLNNVDIYSVIPKNDANKMFIESEPGVPFWDTASFWLGGVHEFRGHGSYEVSLCKSGNFVEAKFTNMQITWGWVDEVDAHDVTEYNWKKNGFGQGLFETTLGDWVGDKAFNGNYMVVVGFIERGNAGTYEYNPVTGQFWKKARM